MILSIVSTFFLLWQGKYCTGTYLFSRDILFYFSDFFTVQKLLCVLHLQEKTAIIFTLSTWHFSIFREHLAWLSQIQPFFTRSFAQWATITRARPKLYLYSPIPTLPGPGRADAAMRNWARTTAQPSAFCTRPWKGADTRSCGCMGQTTRLQKLELWIFLSFMSMRMEVSFIWLVFLF